MTDREQVRRDAERAVVFDTAWIRLLGKGTLALLAELKQTERERDIAKGEAIDLHHHWTDAERRLAKAEAQLSKVPALVERQRRLLWIAEHLFQVIPQQTWREEGGDDGQGHYEGDYRAERLRIELEEHADALAAFEQEQKP